MLCVKLPTADNPTLALVAGLPLSLPTYTAFFSLDTYFTCISFFSPEEFVAAIVFGICADEFGQGDSIAIDRPQH